MSTPTEVPLACLLLNSDQSRGAVQEKPRIAKLHFLDFVVISVTTTKTQLYFPVGRESRCNLSIQIESSKATTCRLHPSLLGGRDCWLPHDFGCWTLLAARWWSGVDNNNTTTQLYARKKSLLGNVCLNFLHQIIVNNLMA